MSQPVIFTTHSIERYVERVRPGIDQGMARLELLALSPFGEVVDTPPGDWCKPHAKHPVDAWLLIGDIVFPLHLDGKVLIAVTCEVRGQLRPDVREYRNATRRRRMPKRLNKLDRSDGRKARRRARAVERAA